MHKRNNSPTKMAINLAETDTAFLNCLYIHYDSNLCQEKLISSMESMLPNLLSVSELQSLQKRI